MIIKILGAESLGVRGLSCLVELKIRKIFIDPGIALGWSRYGFLPHPFQIAIGAGIREKIIVWLVIIIVLGIKWKRKANIIRIICCQMVK